MSALSTRQWLKSVYLSRFSQPSSERVLYRAVRRQRACSIVELGVSMGQRSQRLIQMASGIRGAKSVCYTGIDLFEARNSHTPGMTLKRAHRLLRSSGATVKLVPGDPLSALARTANSLAGTDLLIVALDQDRDSLAQAWFYVPRMLHEHSLVFVEESAATSHTRFRRLTTTEITDLADAASGDRSRRAA